MPTLIYFCFLPCQIFQILFIKWVLTMFDMIDAKDQLRAIYGFIFSFVMEENLVLLHMFVCCCNKRALNDFCILITFTHVFEQQLWGSLRSFSTYRLLYFCVVTTEMTNDAVPYSLTLTQGHMIMKVLTGACPIPSKLLCVYMRMAAHWFYIGAKVVTLFFLFSVSFHLPPVVPFDQKGKWYGEHFPL